jgi:hypothetical protein
MVILPGITSSWKRNLPEKCFSAVNYKLKDEKSSRGRDIPLGITSSWTRNPAEEGIFRRELLANGR